MIGGAEKIPAKDKELYDQGKYRHAVEILNKLVYAEPNNQAAKDLALVGLIFGVRTHITA
jgi:alkyl sulfatase BDS1-like metallo-beta-lactamase superfamily hydrolase